ncbi:MAG: ribbon-helix-helix domain-containing protein [Gemmataceae bacterium]|nr:ribbon-helix-helix domain-containing protein [Gemmataceae bacterium]
MKTLALSLPDDLHERIRRMAKAEARPTTEIVRHAIFAGLAIRERGHRRRDILAYARRMVGSRQDLDTDLESASIECLKSSLDDQE